MCEWPTIVGKIGYEVMTMIDQASLDTMLQRVDVLGRKIEQLRRDLLRGLAASPAASQRKPSLFGSVPAGDISDEMIAEVQRDLFRPLDDL